MIWFAILLAAQQPSEAVYDYRDALQDTADVSDPEEAERLEEEIEELDEADPEEQEALADDGYPVDEPE